MAANFIHSYTPRGGTENVRNKMMSAKSFSAAKVQSAGIKKALVDVGNTLHKKTLFSASKPSTSTKQKDLMQVFGDKENVNVHEKLKETKQKQTFGEAIEKLNLKDDNDIPAICHCHESTEDEFADILFKDIRLSKSQVEDLALVWENPPMLSVKDKRNVCENIKSIDNIEMLDEVFSSSLEDEFDDVKFHNVPPPYFF